MTRRWDDIAREPGISPDGMYWVPDAPGFLERNGGSEPSHDTPVIGYEQARLQARRAIRERQEQDERTRSDYTSFIDFDGLDRLRASGDTAAPRDWEAPIQRKPSYRIPAAYDPDISRAAAARQRGGRGSAMEYRRYGSEVPDSRGGSRYGGDFPASTRYTGTRRPSGYAGRTAGQREREPWQDGPARADRTPAHNRRQQRAIGRDEAGAQGAGPEDGRETPSRNPLRAASRKLRRWRADRTFERDYDQAPEEAAGPRAALYKGEMGRTHQRSARMQQSASAGRAVAAGSVFNLPVLRNLGNHWRAAVMLLVLACVGLSAYGIYPDAQNYYAQIRDNDQAQAEYQAVLERNDELGEHVAALQTDEGMEQLAHETLGWVMDGENSVSVIREGSSDIPSEAQDATAAVAEGSVPAPETWYSPILDEFFGYEG